MHLDTDVCTQICVWETFTLSFFSIFFLCSDRALGKFLCTVKDFMGPNSIDIIYYFKYIFIISKLIFLEYFNYLSIEKMTLI